MLPFAPQLRRVYRALAPVAEYAGLLSALGLMIAYFGYRAGDFLSVTTFLTLANQNASILVIAMGMTFVLIVGGIDLSVGSVMALSGTVMGALMVRLGWPVAAALAACLAVGALCGLVNGLVITTWRVPSFIVTLGMLEMARGGTYLVNRESEYIGRPIAWIAEAKLLGLSAPFLMAILLIVVGQVVLSMTTFGRRVRAVGEAEEAARLSGVSSRPVKLTVFTLSGLMAGLAAVFQTSRVSSAVPNAGSGVELKAIAAVVIGGTSLLGGRGSVVKSFLGVSIIAILDSGLTQVGVPDPFKWLVRGAVIVAAGVLDHYRQRLRRGR